MTITITPRCHSMLAPKMWISDASIPSSVGLTGEPRYLGVVPCQSPMNAMSTIEAPRVAITTTCTERPRSGA